MAPMLVAVGAVAVAAMLLLCLDLGGMMWVQTRRRLQQARCYLTTLRRGRVGLQEFHASLSAAYDACGFARPLAPGEAMQLALQAGFPPAAASRLAQSLQQQQQQQQRLQLINVQQQSQKQQVPQGVHTATPATHAASRRPAAATAVHQGRRIPLKQRPAVGISAWRFHYFMWWLHSHLETLQLLREEWDQRTPLLICGFDVTRNAATALLFRRPKGTCLVRLGREVGGVIVSLRPDKASLPVERRTPESYFGSVSAAALAGAAYELAEQPWLPQRRKIREGAVVHVFVPNHSLRTCGGLWGCLRRMRHTKLILDAAVGHTLPSVDAFQQLPPGDRLAPGQLHRWRQQAVAQQGRARHAAGVQRQQREQEPAVLQERWQPAPHSNHQRLQQQQQQQHHDATEAQQQAQQEQQLELLRAGSNGSALQAAGALAASQQW